MYWFLGCLRVIRESRVKKNIFLFFPCVCFFSWGWDKIFWQNQLKGQRFFSDSHSPSVQSIMIWQRSQCGRCLKHAKLCLQSESEERWMHVVALFFVCIHTVLDPMHSHHALSTNVVRIIPQRCAQKSIFQVTFNNVYRTILTILQLGSFQILN